MDKKCHCYTELVKAVCAEKSNIQNKTDKYSFEIVCLYYVRWLITHLKPNSTNPSNYQTTPKPHTIHTSPIPPLGKLLISFIYSIWELNKAIYVYTRQKMRGVARPARHSILVVRGPGPVFFHFNFFPKSHLISGTYKSCQAWLKLTHPSFTTRYLTGTTL